MLYFSAHTAIKWSVIQNSNVSYVLMIVVGRVPYIAIVSLKAIRLADH